MMHGRLVALLGTVVTCLTCACHYTMQLPPPATVDVTVVYAPPSPTVTYEESPDATNPSNQPYTTYTYCRRHDGATHATNLH